MLTFFIMVGLVGYGLRKMSQFIKTNPSQAADAAEWLKRLFGKQ